MSPTGEIYFAEGDQRQRVRKIDLRDRLSTVAGNGTEGYSGDGGPATAAAFDAISALAFGPDGTLYLADSNNNRVRRISSTGVVTTVAGTGEAFTTPPPDGVPATQSPVDTPFGIAFGADGSWYVSELNGYRVRKVSPAGIITTVAGTGERGYSGDGGPALDAELNSPGALAVDPVGNLYVSHSSLELPGGLPIRRISTDGTISTYGLIPPGGNCPTGCVSINSLAVAGTAVYATFGGLNAVFALNGQTTVLAVGTGQAGFSGDGGPPTSAQLFAVGGVALDSFGDLVITDSGNERIRLVAEGRPRHQPAAH